MTKASNKMVHFRENVVGENIYAYFVKSTLIDFDDESSTHVLVHSVNTPMSRAQICTN